MTDETGVPGGGPAGGAVGTADGAPGTRVIVGAVTTTVASVLPVFLTGGLAVQIADELGFSPDGLGLAVAVYFGVSALTSMPAGAVVERFGAAAAARAGILLAASSMLAVALLARNLTALTVLLVAGAGANSLGQLSSNAALSRVPAGRQGLSFGLKQSAIPVATLLAGLAVPTIGLTVGWRWAFVAAALAGTAALALVPPDPRGIRATDRRTRGRPGRPSAYGALVTIGVAVTLGAASASSQGVFLVDSAVARGLAPGVAGLALTLGSVACATSRVALGWAADRRRTHGDVLTVTGLLLVGAVGLGLLSVPGTAALVAGVLLGFGFGWAFPGLVNFAVVQLNPQAPAAATSITQTGVYVGGSLGPLAFGALAAAGGYPLAWQMAALAMLGGAALMLLARLLLNRRPAPTTG